MHIVIIGNGIAGITAARHIRKLSDHKITVISGETDHFFSRTALMYIYMGHMRFEDTKPYEDWFWEKNRIELVRGFVEKVEPQSKLLHFEDGKTLAFDRLLIATGSKSNKFGWPGQDLEGVQGLYSYQDLEGMERYSPGLKRAVIVGGGLIGIEMAEMFHSRHIPVTFLVREKSFWDLVLPLEESQMINRHILENGIDLRLETELKEILPDANGKARAVVTNKGETIECGFVGLTAGVSPNVDFLKDSGIEMGRGVLVNDFLETNIPGVFAAGDCVQLQNPKHGRRPIEAVWYTGRMMGETAAHNIVRGGQSLIPYDPGTWFNSAKFFDIEYQVYGTVLANPPENHAVLYWEHSDGRRSIRLVYDRHTGGILGLNLMGVRYRQEVCVKWLESGTPIEEVLQNLGMANFDPEFYKEYENDVVALYNRQSGRNLTLKKRRGLAGALDFLRA
ncbi:MAG: FAD-dependent oxidoreductase [Saprospiraceae bacterium]|nr:FAD-dependent oxidoreductase [Saprospiraceae bacterium]MCF8248690.1 FAD-dependent oxidoreductase [Saprospiraceae bacterium]MCF8310620.1 FAD-dependent oxidoreductase [Saprospiraceae bacterium]MCF8439179.1 FAD-dependent oxidoreductase [Saprospiraceae bacterium]